MGLVAASAGVTTRAARVPVRCTASAKVTTSTVHVDASVHASASPKVTAACRAIKTSTAGRHACMGCGHHASFTHAASAHHHAPPTVTEGNRAGGR